MPLLFLLPPPPNRSTRSEATEGVSGNPFPVPLWGCHAVTGGRRHIARSAKRPKGFRGILSPCPQGLSRSDWGSEVSAELLVALRYSDKIVCF